MIARGVEHRVRGTASGLGKLGGTSGAVSLGGNATATVQFLADVATTLDGYLTTDERTSARYASNDVTLKQPLSWSYDFFRVLPLP